MKVYILEEYDSICRSSHVWGVYSTKEKAEAEKENIKLDLAEEYQGYYFYSILEREVE